MTVKTALLKARALMRYRTGAEKSYWRGIIDGISAVVPCQCSECTMWKHTEEDMGFCECWQSDSFESDYCSYAMRTCL